MAEVHYVPPVAIARELLKLGAEQRVRALRVPVGRDGCDRIAFVTNGEIAGSGLATSDDRAVELAILHFRREFAMRIVSDPYYGLRDLGGEG